MSSECVLDGAGDARGERGDDLLHQGGHLALRHRALAARTEACLLLVGAQRASRAGAGHGVGNGGFNLGSESSEHGGDQLLPPHLLGSSSSLGSGGLGGNSSEALSLGFRSSRLLLGEAGHRGGCLPVERA